RSSRDRDRLRQDVLENLGWQIHRIWSTDWFNHPERELRRALGAIEQARLRGTQPPKPDRREALPSGQSSSAVVRVAQDPEPILQELTAERYVICDLKIDTGHFDLHEVSANRFAGWIAEVVKVEGPVHRDEVARRIAEGAGVQRIGTRIGAAVDRGIRTAVQMKLIEQRIDFLWTIGLTRPTVRNRRDVATRKIELIAPEEIAEAICLVVKRAYGIDLDDISQAVCRLFGFGRTSEDMAAVVNSTASMLAETGLLVIADGRVTIGKTTEPDGPPPLRLVRGSGR
ncbi:MAG: DUF3320 domain-containing protein, partial [Gammaproteobacteria bacterium]